MNARSTPVSVPAAVLEAVRAGRVTPPVRPQPDPLTVRQRQIMPALLGGRTAAQAALQLGISANTVNRTVQEAYKRLGVHNRMQAALALGVIGRAR